MKSFIKDYYFIYTMKRTNEHTYLVVISGMDKIGKNTLIDWVAKNNPNDYIVYKSNKSALSTVQDIRKLHEKYPDKYIITKDLWIKDAVYSTSNVNYKNDIEDIFNGKVINIVFAWKSVYDYSNRIKKITGRDFLCDENAKNIFSKTKKLFEKYGLENDAKIFNNITNDSTPSSMYEKYERVLCSIF